MQHSFNNQLGSRSLQHLNVLYAPVGDAFVLFEFAGKSIPGAVQVVSESYVKNGKWSHTTWAVELAEGIHAFRWVQDWGTGAWMPGQTWAAAHEYVQIEARRAVAGLDLDPQAVERFIRARFPQIAARLDKAAAESAQDPTPVLAELLAAQEALAQAQAEKAQAQAEVTRFQAEVQAAIDARNQAEQAKKDAAELKERASKARAAMAKGASLADLKALLA